jgi:hypothetical protein
LNQPGKNNKVLGVSKYLSIITLNGFYSLIKRYILADWIKNMIQPFAFFKKHTSLAKTCKTEIKRIKNNIPSNRSRKQTGVGILISGKVDFKPKLVRRDKQDHFILINGIKENVTIVHL